MRRGHLVAILLAVGACRPASYEREVQVQVPTSPPADGPDAEPPAPRARVHVPASHVKVMVPRSVALPRRIKKKSGDDG